LVECVDQDRKIGRRGVDLPEIEDDELTRAFLKALAEVETRPEVKKVIQEIGEEDWYNYGFILGWAAARKLIFDSLDEILHYRRKHGKDFP